MRVRRSGLYPFDARPPRFSTHDGGVLPGQVAASLLAMAGGENPGSAPHQYGDPRGSAISQACPWFRVGIAIKNRADPASGAASPFPLPNDIYCGDSGRIVSYGKPGGPASTTFQTYWVRMGVACMTAPRPIIRDGVAQITNVPGRFERVRRGQDFTVVVDYAHTEMHWFAATAAPPPPLFFYPPPLFFPPFFPFFSKALKTHPASLQYLGAGGSRPRQATEDGPDAVEYRDVVCCESDNPRIRQISGDFAEVAIGVREPCKGAASAVPLDPRFVEKRSVRRSGKRDR